MGHSGANGGGGTSGPPGGPGSMRGVGALWGGAAGPGGGGTVAGVGAGSTGRHSQGLNALNWQTIAPVVAPSTSPHAAWTWRIITPSAGQPGHVAHTVSGPDPCQGAQAVGSPRTTRRVSVRPPCVAVMRKWVGGGRYVAGYSKRRTKAVASAIMVAASARSTPPPRPARLPNGASQTPPQSCPLRR